MSDTNKFIELEGLDGSNPLAFLAALGFLRAATEVRQQTRLGWNTRNNLAVLYGWTPHDQETLADCSLQAIERVVAILDPQFYPSKIPAINRKACRSFCTSGVTNADNLQCKIAASLSCEGANYLWEPKPSQKKKGMTSEERASGSQLCNADNPGGKCLVGLFRQFPSLSVRAVEEPVSQTRNLRSFLLEVMQCWKYHSPDRYSGAAKFPAFRWDPIENRPAAHVSEAPDADNLASVPGGNAMAMLGLTFFVSVPAPKIVTACVDRDHFSWPLWESPLECDVIASLFAQQSLWSKKSFSEALGIAVVFSCPRWTDENGSHFFLDSTAS